MKSRDPNIQVIAVEPEESPVLSGGHAGSHNIPGIGPGFIPKNCDTTLIDGVQRVTSDDAMVMARMLATKEGIFAGVSSGAAVASAMKLGRRPENKDKNIVVIIPSGGERYLSTDLFAKLREETVNQGCEPIDAEWKMN